MTMSSYSSSSYEIICHQGRILSSCLGLFRVGFPPHTYEENVRRGLHCTAYHTNLIMKMFAQCYVSVGIYGTITGGTVHQPFFLIPDLPFLTKHRLHVLLSQHRGRALPGNMLPKHGHQVSDFSSSSSSINYNNNV